MSLDEKRVTARVAGRQAARDLFDLLAVPEDYGVEYAEALLSEFRSMLPQRPAEPTATVKGTPLPVLRAIQFPFGAHRGKRFDDVPLSYLEWLLSEQEGFHKLLREYLNHPEIVAEKAMQDED